MARFLNVPEYLKKYINKNIDLNETPKICCPFHKEDTPSFSYNPASGRWRCFGACHTGGDVIDMHRINYRIKSRLDAEKSLRSLEGMPALDDKALDLSIEPVILNEDDLELDKIYNLCLLNANTVDRWISMDYVMSIYPVDVVRLKTLLQEWGVKYD